LESEQGSKTVTLYRAVEGAVYKAVVAILRDKDFKDALSPREKKEFMFEGTARGPCIMEIFVLV